MAKKSKKAVASSKIVVSLKRSGIGRDQRTRNTLNALGLNRIGAEKELISNDAVLGMVAKVSHLVEVRSA